jgi:hypothetical protein
MLIVLLLFELALAKNPLVGGVGMADTNVHFFDDKFVIFATHDYSTNNTGFLMKDWWCWTSTDLVNWDKVSVVDPAVAVPWSTQGQRSECWATDGAYRNQKYYFYLSVGPNDVGVVTSDTPAGPWTDPIGKALLSSDMAKHLHPSTAFRDPCVFMDDDGEFFIISGVFEYYVAKLGTDMVSLAEPLRHVTVNNPYGACGNGTTDDKPFIHKNNGTYYLSWGCFYGMSKSVYGPYDMQGSVIDTAKIVPSFRMNNSSPQPPLLGRAHAGGATATQALRRPQTWFAEGVPGSQCATLGDARANADLSPVAPAVPAAGDGLELFKCATARASKFAVLNSTKYPGSFQLQLLDDTVPAKSTNLCVTGSADRPGKSLIIDTCASEERLVAMVTVDTSNSTSTTGTTGTAGTVDTAAITRGEAKAKAAFTAQLFTMEQSADLKGVDIHGLR